MKIKILSVSVAAVIAAWAPPGLAREALGLPATVGAVGSLTGVDTTGAGLLTVGNNQNVNTSNDPGGAVTSNLNDVASILFGGGSTITGFTGTNPIRFTSISAGAVGTTVNFNGAVFTTTFQVTGTGTVNFNGNVNQAIVAANTIFNNDGFISVGSGRIFNSAIVTLAANTGTLTLNGGSSVIGAIGALASGIKQINVVGGNAAITGAVFARDFSLGTNTLAIVGAVTPSVGATIATSFASNALFGKIAATGNSNVTSPITVLPTVTAPLTVGTTYMIVDGTAGGTIGTVVNVINSDPRFTFVGVPVNVDGDVRITLAAANLAAPGAPPAAAAVGPILVAPAAPGSDLLAVQTALIALPLGSINDALKQLAPGTTNLAAPWVAGQTTRLFDDLWMARVDEIQKLCCSPCEPSQSGGPVKATECKGNDKRSNWWGKGFGSEGRQGDVDGRSGYRSEAFGLMLAHDTPLNQDTRVGLGGAYANTTIDGNNSTGHTKIDSYQLTAYVSHAPGPWYVQGAVTAGTDQYKGSRTIAFTGINRKASADYTGQQYSGVVTAGRHFNVNQTIVTPLASLQASRIRVESYKESGAGDVNLRVRSQDYDFVQSTLGVKAERVMQAGNGTYSPEVHLKWMHDFSSTTMQQNAAFVGGGTSFETQGVKQDRELFNVGAGISFLSCNCGENSWTVKGLYDYKWNNSDYSSHKLSLLASRSF